MGGIIGLLQHCRAWNRGKNCIIQSYAGHNAGKNTVQRSRQAAETAGDSDPGAGGAERAKALCVIFFWKF